jgi:hypothetical protein
MRTVLPQITEQYANVKSTTLEIPTLNVSRLLIHLPHHQRRWNPVNLIHVDLIPTVEQEMVLQFALVMLATLESLVDQNV